MTHRLCFLSPDCAVVSYRPSWLARLFGRRPWERMAVRVQEFRGRWTWLWLASGKRVDAEFALEAARAREIARSEAA